MTIQNDLFLRALKGEKTERTPIWVMRQAGRYLPEYRATRAKAGSFLNLCKTPELACEVTLQPLDRYGFDAAILFSDILTVPDAMGLGLHFIEGEGPKFLHPIRQESDVLKQSALSEQAVADKLAYVTDAITLIKKTLAGRVPLIGFSGSPWTLACYMVEGQGSDDFALVKSMLYARPDLMQRLLDINTLSVAAYLNAQIDAGVDAVMIFDTWGGALPDGVYQSTSLACMKRVLSMLKNNPQTGEPVPSIVFTKGGGVWLSDILQIGSSAVGLDWTMGLAKARGLVKQSGRSVALQGNLDPVILQVPSDQYGHKAIKQAVKDVLASYGDDGVGHIFNLGHGISQHTPLDNVSVLVESVRELSHRS
jgi:uroporphyrinogen decarboxylase